MIDPIANVANANPVELTPANAPSAAASPKLTPSTSAPTDSVKISSSAQSAVTEALELQSQTVKEANSGDRQAQGLLAREEAATKA